MNKKKYETPIIKVVTINMESCITSTSVARVSQKIEEEWTEEEIVFDKITW